MICGQVGVNNTEDLLYASEILVKAETIFLIPESYYTYFSNIDSLTHIINSDQYFQTQVIILKQLQKIVTMYKANLKLTNNILNYFENRLYLSLAKMHFGRNEDLNNTKMLVKELLKSSLMTPSRIFRIKLSMKNKYINLLEVTLRLGLRLTLRIILRSFKKQIII